MKVLQKRKLLLLHLIVLGLLLLAVVKYCEEIHDIKEAVHHRVMSMLDSGMPEETVPTQPPETTPEEIILQPATPVADAWFADAPLIYHAGGGIGTSTYTNSLEAVEETLSQGGRVLEIDFDYTSDGYLVCSHIWRDIFPEEAKPTLEEFCQARIQGKYTPMTAEDLVGIMRENPQMYIVTDTKTEVSFLQVVEDLVRIAEEDPAVLERVIIQLYDAGEKAGFQQMYPFADEQFLFTTYKRGGWQLEMAQICSDEGISVITSPYGVIPDADVQMLRELGYTLYEHTVNRVDEVQYARNRGISGFYTDFLSTEDLEAAME